jgi:hypothetical protein
MFEEVRTGRVLRLPGGSLVLEIHTGRPLRVPGSISFVASKIVPVGSDDYPENFVLCRI